MINLVNSLDVHNFNECGHAATNRAVYGFAEVNDVECGIIGDADVKREWSILFQPECLWFIAILVVYKFVEIMQITVSLIEVNHSKYLYSILAVTEFITLAVKL